MKMPLYNLLHKQFSQCSEFDPNCTKNGQNCKIERVYTGCTKNVMPNLPTDRGHPPEQLLPYPFYLFRAHKKVAKYSKFLYLQKNIVVFYYIILKKFSKQNMKAVHQFYFLC